jgi:hypothetical protein
MQGGKSFENLSTGLQSVQLGPLLLMIGSFHFVDIPALFTGLSQLFSIAV